MSRDVTVTAPALPGIVPDVEAAAIARAYHAKIDDYGQGVLGLPTLPTAQERAILEQRQSVLRRELRPITYATADRDRAMRALGRLFSGYPTLQNQNLIEKAATYAMDLNELPAFAVEAAVEDFKKNRVPDVDIDYPPSSTRVFKVAAGHRDRLATNEMRPIERVLSVTMLSKPQQTEEEVKKVAGLMRGFADGLKADDELRDRTLSEERVQKARVTNERLMMREWSALGLEPVTQNVGGHERPISVALARTLNMIPQNPPDRHPNAPGRR